MLPAHAQTSGARTFFGGGTPSIASNNSIFNAEQLLNAVIPQAIAQSPSPARFSSIQALIEETAIGSDSFTITLLASVTDNLPSNTNLARADFLYTGTISTQSLAPLSLNEDACRLSDNLGVGSISAQVQSIDATAAILRFDDGSMVSIPSGSGSLPSASCETDSGPITTTGSASSVELPDRIVIDIDVPISHPGAPTLSIVEVTLALDIQHTFLGDLTFTLTSPQGTSSVLVDRIGAGDSTFGCGFGSVTEIFQVTLDDSASAMLPVNQADCPDTPITGTFTTGGALGAFNGQDPDGDWVLNINDNAGGDAGMLNSATLTVRCA